MNVVGYIRVSTDKQESSPAVQRDAIERWCREQGHTLKAVYEERVSGGAELDNRHILLDAINTLNEGDALVVMRRDRLARDVMAAAMIERLVSRRGASIVAVDGTGNGNSPEAILMRRMVDAFAEYERAIIRLRIVNTKRHYKKRGAFLGGRVPYGQAVGEDGETLVKDAEEVKLIRRIKRMHREGKSVRDIASKLAAEGITTRSGRPMTKSTIHNLLKS
jgi:DNA invertase Pin-like site-specific DNA recombinase